MEWKPIETAKEEDLTKVDLWLEIPATMRSFGYSDSLRVADAFMREGKWMHSDDRGVVRELRAEYITHWMKVEPPKEKPSVEG